ncbi:MAG TPA: hypothetical protein VIX59_13460 [Candidatus Binataceae bacterium]
MSYDEHDAERDRFFDEVSKELYPEHRDQAIDEFATECLQRFYLADPNVLVGPLSLLEESRNLIANHSAAALVFASAAIETLVKSALLKPLVCGVVNNESIALVLASSLLDRVTSFENLKKLLFSVIAEHAAIDMRSFKRGDSSTELWQEILSVQRLRNAVVHRGEFPSEADARMGIAVAEFVLDVLFARVVRSVQLHLHESRICSVAGTVLCPGKPLPSIPARPPAPSETLDELRDYILSQDRSAVNYFLKTAKLALRDCTLTVCSSSEFLKKYQPSLERYASDLYRKKIIVEFAQ